MTVTINADMGESYGIHTFGHDADLLPLVDTVNVACGAHAGDPGAMRETVRAAGAAGVGIGAHPGLPDPVGFGRREMRLFPDEVRDLVLYQVGALVGFLAAEGLALDHLKPHGSLYGMVGRDPELMDAVCDVAVQYGVPVYGLAGTAHEQVAARRGVPFVAELFVDLGYDASGRLGEQVAARRGVPFVGELFVDLGYDASGRLLITRRPSATDPGLAAERARRALAEQVVVADTGERLPVRFDSICVHSDTATAVQVATAVRAVVGAPVGRAVPSARP